MDIEIKFKVGDSLQIPEGCKATIKDDVIILEHDFNDGDVLVNKDITFIYRKQGTKEATYYVCYYEEEIRYGETANNRYVGYIEEARYATNEEKQILFDKMKEQGLRWNAEEKRVEKVRWRASSEERYYYVNNLLECNSDIEDSYTFGKEMWKVCNYFRTEEQAEEAAKRVKETLRKYHEEIGE